MVDVFLESSHAFNSIDSPIQCQRARVAVNCQESPYLICQPDRVKRTIRLISEKRLRPPGSNLL